MNAQLSLERSILGIFIGVSAFFMSNPAVMAGEQCRELIDKKCLMCHSHGRTCAKLGADKEQWQRTISAMAAYSPSITGEQQKVMVKCLAKQKKDVKTLCSQ